MQLALWLRCNSQVLDTSEGFVNWKKNYLLMFLFPFLLCIPLFPFSKSKQFLLELKSGKDKIIETNNGSGVQQELSIENKEAVKNISKLKSGPKKVENKVENEESTTLSHLTTTDKISEGQDYFFFEFVCFLFQFCPFGNPFTGPTQPTQTTVDLSNYEWVPFNQER